MDQQQELHVQAAMIEELDQEMDKANAQLTNVNHKMKDVLEQAGGGQRSKHTPYTVLMIIIEIKYALQDIQM